jgi:Ca-activated chloride channel family protein
VTLLDPLAAFAGLTIVPIVALYFLKARRPYHVISSTLWWRPVTLDRQAAVPWQRLRPSWLLVLQVLAAALVLGALLRPAFATAQALTGQTIVVIDTSVTMQATDVAPSRFAKAVADARALVNRLGPQARMTLISMGANPVVLASSNGDRQPLLAALAHLRPTDGQADLQDALQLAVAAAASRRQGTHLVVLSDGVTEPLSEPVTLPFPVAYERIGESGENSGVTSVSIVHGPTGDQAVAHVQDFGREPAHLTVLMEADGRLTDAQAVDLGPGGGQDVSFSVPPGSAYVKVSILPGGALGADDSAYAVVAPSRALRVLLVTPGDVFLQQALSLRADVKVTTETPAAYRAASTQTGGSADLVVFDQYVPPTLPPATPFLLVAPPPDAKLSFGPPVVPGQLLPAEANDPLLYDVDLSNVDVAASTDLTRSQFGRWSSPARLVPCSWSARPAR